MGKRWCSVAAVDVCRQWQVAGADGAGCVGCVGGTLRNDDADECGNVDVTKLLRKHLLPAPVLMLFTAVPVPTDDADDAPFVCASTVIDKKRLGIKKIDRNIKIRKFNVIGERQLVIGKIVQLRLEK